MSDNWTSRRIRKTLGVKKCNGSWDAAVEELTMDQIYNRMQYRGPLRRPSQCTCLSHRLQ